MANIGTAPGDIGYAPVHRWVTEPGRIRRMWTITFPLGANVTYPAGGIPLDKPSLGCPRYVQRLSVIGATPVAGNSNPRYVWNGDQVNPKLVALANGAAGAADAEVSGAVAAGQSIICDVEGY